MLRSSSSTFSSELVRSKRLNDFTQLKRYVLGIVLWTIGALVLFDAVVGLTFRQPSDPRQASSSLQTYFDYGRSIEGKLRRLVGSTPEQDAPIVEAGWLANDCDIATPPSPGKLAFDIYGMSHSDQLAEQMQRLNSGLAGHSFAGPAAPASHSYACFVRRVEAKHERAPVQILGLLASQILRLETISGLTTSFEGQCRSPIHATRSYRVDASWDFFHQSHRAKTSVLRLPILKNGTPFLTSLPLTIYSTPSGYSVPMSSITACWGG